MSVPVVGVARVMTTPRAGAGCLEPRALLQALLAAGAGVVLQEPCVKGRSEEVEAVEDGPQARWGGRRDAPGVRPHTAVHRSGLVEERKGRPGEAASQTLWIRWQGDGPPAGGQTREAGARCRGARGWSTRGSRYSLRGLSGWMGRWAWDFVSRRMVPCKRRRAPSARFKRMWL